MLSMSRHVLPAAVLAVASLLSPNIAFAIEESNLDPALPTALPSETKAEAKAQLAMNIPTPSPTGAEQAAEAAQPASENFISQGQAVQLELLGVSIVPPTGWEVSTNTGTLSVVMREQRNPIPDYEKAKYQRNITVAAMHRSSPIDEKRAAELKEEMIATFSKDSLVTDFTILEHKFFNYRGQNDGLLVYSSLNIGEYPMMQMHVLVSGQEKQFLMSYTDLADQFQNQQAFEAAWNSMVSIEVTGKTPLRMDEYARYGAVAAGFLMLGLVALLLRRRASKVDYAGDADQYMEEGDDASPSMFATLAGGWRLDAKSDAEVSGIEFSHAQESFGGSQHAPVTRKTEYVSNY